MFQERKRHININKFSGDCRAGGWPPDWVGGGLPTGGQGSKVYVLCVEPKEHKRFRPGARAGGIGDRGDREIVYVPFPAPNVSFHNNLCHLLFHVRSFPGGFGKHLIAELPCFNSDRIRAIVQEHHTNT